MKYIITITLAEGRLVVETDEIKRAEIGDHTHIFVDQSAIQTYDWTPKARVKPTILEPHRKARKGRGVDSEEVEARLITSVPSIKERVRV